MSKTISRSLIAVLYIVHASLLPAQQQVTDSLSLDSCISIAHKHSLLVQRADLQTRLAEIDLSSARSRFLPQVSGSISQGFDFGRSQDHTGVYVNRSSTSTSFGVSAGVNLFSGLARINNIKGARLALEASNLQAERVANDLSLQIAGLYYNVLFKRELCNVARYQLDLSRAQIERTREMVAAGKWGEYKVYEVEAQLSREEVALRRAENDVQLATLDLAQAMNLRSVCPASPSIRTMIDEAGGAVQSADAIYMAATDRLPQIRAARLSIDQALYGVRSARAGYMPSLDLSVGYNNSYFYNFAKEYKSLNRSFGDQWKENGRTGIGLSLRIPIFDAFSTRDQVRKAKISADMAKLELADKEMQLYKEIHQASLNAANALAQIQVAERSLRAADKAFEASTLLFEAGKIGTYEYNDAKTKRMVAQTDLLQAQYDFVYKARVLKFYQSGEAL